MLINQQARGGNSSGTEDSLSIGRGENSSRSIHNDPVIRQMQNNKSSISKSSTEKQSKEKLKEKEIDPLDTAI